MPRTYQYFTYKFSRPKDEEDVPLHFNELESTVGLTRDEWDVLVCRSGEKTGEPMSLIDASVELGINSCERVKQMEMRGLAKIRKYHAEVSATLDKKQD